METVSINGYLWNIKIVDPENPSLIDRTYTARVATTDPTNYTIYLSNELEGEFLVRVLRHELAHAVIFSYGLLSYIHNFSPPEKWIEAEEWICNFIADYGQPIINTTYNILKNDL